MNLDRQITKRTIADEVAELLRRRILSGELPAGKPIRQEHIAQELGISRIPLREALKQLEAEGFVLIEAHKGAVVAELSSAEVEELFELRVRIETWLLSRAIPNMGEGDFARLDAIIDESRAPDSLPRWGEFNWRFHEALYRAAGRPVSIKFLKRIHDNIDRYLRIEITLPAARDRAYGDHEQLVVLCRNRDIPAALSLLERHIMATAKTLVAKFSGSGVRS